MMFLRDLRSDGRVKLGAQSAAAGAALSPDDEMAAEMNALREERALLTDKLNNHPDVRKYAGAPQHQNAACCLTCAAGRTCMCPARFSYMQFYVCNQACMKEGLCYLRRKSSIRDLMRIQYHRDSTRA